MRDRMDAYYNYLDGSIKVGAISVPIRLYGWAVSTTAGDRHFMMVAGVGFGGELRKFSGSLPSFVISAQLAERLGHLDDIPGRRA